MLTIQAKRGAEKDWAGHRLEPAEIPTVYRGAEDAQILREDGTVLAKVIRGGIREELAAQAFPVLLKIRSRTDNRGHATGARRIQKILKSGKVSAVNRASHQDGGIVMSSLVGFFERTPRFPFCRPCAWNQNFPEEYAKLLPFFQRCSYLFWEHMKERWYAQAEIVDKTSQDFVIPGTVYTTATVNHNFRTACHLDAGDLHAGFGNMAYLQRGLLKGGEICFPNYGIGIELRHRDFLLFDVHEWHGNLPLKQLSKSMDRCTVVLYFREKVEGCGSAGDELERAKNRKMGTPMWDAGEVREP